MKKDLLENISERTKKLWNDLHNKKGEHWGLSVNGLGEVLLTEGRYTDNVIAKGNRNIQRVIKELMKK